MAIREWWIEPDYPDQQTDEYFGYAMNFKYQDDDFIHVIDATGMPTKEEIRKSLNAIKASNAITCAELIQWLESLAAE